MGPKSQQAITEGLDAINASLGYLIREAEQNRVLLRKVAAKLDIEIEDREAIGESQGRWLSKHERQINQIAIGTGNAHLVKDGPAE